MGQQGDWLQVRLYEFDEDDEDKDDDRDVSRSLSLLVPDRWVGMPIKYLATAV